MEPEQNISKQKEAVHQALAFASSEQVPNALRTCVAWMACNITTGHGED
jgi:hypothetical protein